jgi:CheY-like chemotaxis protein
MRGAVKAHSIKNVGSSFVAAIACKALSLAPEICNERPLKALVVDDMQSNAEIHKYFLTKCKVEVPDFASNGMEAVDLYRKRGRGFYDLVFMDRNMPIMDGDKASQMIRAYEKVQGWKPTTLVIITGHCKREDYDTMLNPSGEIKADYVFMKPFNFQVCQDLVKALSSKTRCGKKVLVVDDDKFQVQVISEYLSKLNVKAILCFNGKQAVDSYIQCREQIGLIIMDCEMPIMNGYTAALNIKKYCSEMNLDSCPIIGLTGHADIQSKTRCLNSGMTLVETKPISFGQLQNHVQNVPQYS